MMRKLISLSFLAALALSSCQKDYVCRCTTSSGYTYDSEINTTKKKAKKFCEDQATGTKTCSLQ